MKVILTGSTGFLGFALLKHLLEEDHEVVAIVRPNSSSFWKIEEYISRNPDKINRLQILCIDLNELYRLYSDYNIQADIFYHLAWNGSSGTDREDFDRQFVNVGYMADAIRTAKACGCSRIIGAGSQAEYGVVMEKAYESSTVPNPFMMYGATKLAAYQMGKVLASQVGIEFIWPRIYSVYGVGENEGTLVSYVADCLKKGFPPQLSLCENMWNFTDISDCVHMLTELGTNKEVVGGIYNIASDDTRMLKDFVLEMKNIIAPEVACEFGAKSTNPAKTFWLDPDVSKIRAIAGPCKVSFAEGIKRKISE